MQYSVMWSLRETNTTTGSRVIRESVDDITQLAEHNIVIDSTIIDALIELINDPVVRYKHLLLVQNP